MAEETVQDHPAPRPWTPTMQAASSETKIIKLLELGENEKGLFARVEFEDESSRPLYLVTIADAWHHIFSTLKPAEFWKIRRHFNKRLPKLPEVDGVRRGYGHASFMTETLGPRGGFETAP